MIDDLNKLELAVLEWIKSTYANHQLTAQIDSATFLKRHWTGKGVYVYFEVSKELEPVNLENLGGQWPINGPDLASDDIQHGGGTILWGTDGYFNCIEMYAYGEYFRETVTRFELLP